MEVTKNVVSAASSTTAFSPDGSFSRLHEEGPGGEPLPTWTPGVLKHTSPFKQVWDVSVMLCILYSAVVVPFRICFRADAVGSMWLFEALMSILFVVDLGLSFNTAYLQDGEWVHERVAIARRYLAGWFWIDAPSSVPVELLEVLVWSSDDDGGNASLLPAFRLLRMLRVLRIMRVLKIGVYISRLEEHFDMSLRYLRVARLLLVILFIAHLLACGWFLTTWISDDEIENGMQWIHIYDDGSAADGPASRQYFFSFYWALTVISAINPMAPSTDTERSFMVGVSLLNRLLFAYVVGQVSGLIAAIDRQSALVQVPSLEQPPSHHSALLVSTAPPPLPPSPPPLSPAPPQTRRHQRTERG